MLLKENTYQQQAMLAKYTRTNDETIFSQLQNVKEKGIRYYRELIFNIIYDTVSNAYPIMTDFLGEDEMKKIVQRFFSSHSCSNPQVWAMPKEFMNYVNEYEKKLIHEHPFLPELMLFEWKEIEMYMMPDKPLLPYKKKGSVLTDKLVINPEIEILSFSYPVFLLHPENITEETKDDYLIIVYRDLEYREVHYNAINYITEKFIRILLEQPTSFQTIEKSKGLFSIQEKNQIKEFINFALENEIIAGFLKE